nr:MAG TPA: hypothetical protein [Caudoviricetes sp.]
MVRFPLLSSTSTTFPPDAVPISSIFVIFQGFGDNPSYSKICVALRSSQCFLK